MPRQGRFGSNVLVVLAALISSFLISACGGGGGDGASTAAAAPPPAPVAKSILIEAYGDSTMYGIALVNNVSVQVAQPAPAVLQSLLQAKYGATVTVANHGVPSSTATLLLNGDGVNPPWAQQMAQSKAQIVLFNFGINDENIVGGTPAAFEQIENQLVQIAKSAGKTVVIETPNPVTFVGDAPLPQYVAAALRVASTWSTPLIDEFAYLNSLPNWPSMLSDPAGVHPNQAGYELKAKFEFTVIDPLIQKLMAQ